jgi:His/Glu/Gln/Arg/opine family amino acid ABC transporter permease subunit
MAFIIEIVKRLSDNIYLNLIREDRYLFFIKGLGISLEITLIAAIIGGIIGLLVAFARLTNNKILSGIATKYIDVIRGTPAVVQLLIIYFAVFGSSSLNRIFVAGIAFGINSGAYVAELIRAGIQAVDKGQMEAGRSIGLSYPQTMVYIIIPQAVKNILPAMVNEIIVLWKETAIVGLIGIDDLTRAANIVRGRTYSPYTPYLIIALIYFYITVILTAFLGKVERRMRQGD